MSPLTITSLPYTDDLIHRYASLSDLPGFVLLESSDQERGRFDIVTALPYETFEVTRDSSDLPQAFERIQSMLPKHCKEESDLPFQGGAIGYVAYDFGEMLAGIHSIPHACNDMPLIHLGFYDWAIVTDHKTKKVHCVLANTQTNTASIAVEVGERWKHPVVRPHPFALIQPFIPLVTQKEYQEAFALIHQELTRGRSYQVNYTQPFLGEYTGDTWGMYLRVRATNPVPYSAFLRGAEGDLLSFSPERFLCIDQGHVYTSPIKGTAKRSLNPFIDAQLKEALLNSSKNRAENTMIVDLLRNDLGKIAVPGSVKVTSLCEAQSFKAVHHLVSHIEAQCAEEITPLQVFSAAFPGGSITGAPKRESMHIINEREPFARGVYCGSIVYFSAHGRCDSNIAIRTVTAKQDTMYLSAGGGIVMDSDWEDEYRECFIKLAAIIKKE